MTDPRARRPRPAARILLTDPAGRVLLFRFVVDDRPPFWCTPGGAVDPGESYDEAAGRELREETGLDLACGPEIAQRTVEFVTIEGDPVWADERYYHVRYTGGEIHAGGHTELERRVMREWRWFAPDELARHDEAYFPEDLAAMLAALG
jgi:8-oxo-dGTP diphosphatase